MKIKIVFALLILNFLSNYSSAQTKNELEKNFGSRKHYEISDGVIMSARFDKSGQICEANLQPIRFPNDGREVLIDRFLIYPDEIKAIVEKLAPASTRGKLLSPSPRVWEKDMTFKYRTFEYENLVIKTGKTIFIDNDYNEDKIAIEN